jgi:hypothetical protein
MDIQKVYKRNQTFEYSFSEEEKAVLTEIFGQMPIQEVLDKREDTAKIVFEGVEKHKADILEPFLLMMFFDEMLADRLDEIQGKMISKGGLVELTPLGEKTTVNLVENPLLALDFAREYPQLISVSKEGIAKEIKKNPKDERLKALAKEFDALYEEGKKRALRKKSVSILDRITASKQLKAIIAKAEEWKALLYGGN